MNSYLDTSYFLDHDHPRIQKLTEECRESSLSEKEAAICIYMKIRDGWRYYPYRISLKKEDFKASEIAGRDNGNCIEKSILLIACLRSAGIPARIHLAKVRNHIGVEKFIQKFGNDEISPHGMVDLQLEGRWLKVSPAFNRELCEKLNVPPLDFDGEHDSLFQKYDNSGNTFMEYLEDYGHFEDVPMKFILDNFMSHYPQIFKDIAGKEELFI